MRGSACLRVVNGLTEELYEDDPQVPPGGPSARIEPPSPQDPDTYFGPFASQVVPVRSYTVVYFGRPALDSLKPSQRLVYGYVRSWNDSQKPCFASAHTIALATGLSEHQVRRTINMLTSMGFLRKTTRKGRPPILEARRDL